MVEIRVPQLGESINEAAIARWLKKEGDYISQDEPLVELETDKVTLEVTAPKAGKLVSILANVNAEVSVGDVIAKIDESAKGESAPTENKEPEPAPESKEEPASAAKKAEEDFPTPEPEPMPQPATPPQPEETPSEPARSSEERDTPSSTVSGVHLTPAARRIVAEKNIDISQFDMTNITRKVTKGDVLSFVERKQSGAVSPVETMDRDDASPDGRVPMSRMRVRIAQRMKDAQNTAAMLTTFNEADMSSIISLRHEYQASFTEAHGIKLGFMSFFVKASVAALRKFPIINASIDGDDIVYHKAPNIGIAVSIKDALVVPVLHSADKMSFADIELGIVDARKKGEAGQLKPSDFANGTFTITNGGIFGSLLSTPILNYPQSAILGMHAIQKRPVIDENGQIVVRDMMYLALTYDHRLIDGKDAVQFLVTIKEHLENPTRLFLAV